MRILLLMGMLMVLAGGIVFSIQDWRQWRHIELDKYGQGTGQIAYPTASPLGRLYSHSLGKFRLKYPQNWTITENKQFTDPKTAKFPLFLGQRVQLVSFDSPESTARIIVWEESAQGIDLPNFINHESQGVTKDREFVNTDFANMTVLTWENSSVRQLAISAKGDRILLIEVLSDKDAWIKYAQTFTKVFQSLVWL